MNMNISLTSAKNALVTFLHRFHVMIFVVVVLMGMIFIIYTLYNIILKSTDTTGQTPDTTSITFDEATIKRIKELKTHDQSDDKLDLSNGRSNPFVE